MNRSLHLKVLGGGLAAAGADDNTQGRAGSVQ